MLWKNSKTSQVFDNLCSLLSELPVGLAHPRAVYTYGYEDYLKIQDGIARSEKRRRIRMLEEKRIIKLKKEGDRIVIQLTHDGQIEKIKRKLLHNSNQLPSNQVCLVLFDVPEDIREVRNMFRGLLKSLQFRFVQKSVWEGDRDVVKDLIQLVQKLRIGRWCYIYIATKC